jgi:hypothetical protein
MKIVITSDTLCIDDKIIIDARKQISEQNPKGWVNPRAYKEIGEIWQTLRKTYIANEDVEGALRKIVREKLGGEQEVFESVEIEGGIPEHWKETAGERKKFR